MNVRYRVELNQSEREQLTALLSGGKHPARKLKRAQILLAADSGVSDEVIATSLAIAGSTIYRTKRRFVEGNLEAALSEEPRPGAARKLTGKEEALLVATACSKPPEGRARWTLELLAGAMVKLTEHEDLSARRCVGASPRTISSRGARTCGASRKSTAPTLPTWRTCSISTPSYPIQSGRWCALTRAQPNSSARCVNRSQPRRGSSNAMTANISATARPIYSSSSISIAAGAGSRSPSTAPLATSPNVCANSSTPIIQRPPKCASCSITCRHTHAAHSTKPSRRAKLTASYRISNSTTPPS